MRYRSGVTDRDRFAAPDTFPRRHLGPKPRDLAAMLDAVGVSSLEELADATVPASIRLAETLSLPAAASESEALAELAAICGGNQVRKNYLGMGYYGCLTPPVIQRNILENPGWYTQYTPYQAEIAQGRLEALLNFQTMVSDLSGLPLANASLLDEATAAAEAMAMCHAAGKRKRSSFFVASDCHPQTIAVVKTRAEPLNITVHVGDPDELRDEAMQELFGILVQYPSTDGRLRSYDALCRRAHDAGAQVVMASDLLALTLLRPPGEIGADIAIGSTQRFGVPLGYGGPHAAFLATTEEHKRQLPGRLIGVSKGRRGEIAYRLALQTREQHIRRDRATSNICTAQVLLAIMASMYAVYHGPEGLREIAERVRGLTGLLREGLRRLGYSLAEGEHFDTLRVTLGAGDRERVLAAADARRINLRRYDDGLGMSLDETTGPGDVFELLEIWAPPGAAALSREDLEPALEPLAAAHRRESPLLSHEVFHRYHSEHEMLRYLHRLESKDLSLTTSMIPLGSCTMKLNATSEMLPVTWPTIGGLHPFCPAEQAEGYATLCSQLESWLANLTGFAAVSLMPNAGAQGEYAGLLVIRAYHRSRGESERDVCLIPVSAHGTNPASAVMAGFRVVAVACDAAGNIDIEDLRKKASLHSARLAAVMITYPSTHGVFEHGIRDICAAVHEHGGQVYLDGANMNAQLGLCRPGDYGADVCHLNLHKTFCIPHGGGGPGMGPIGVAPQLVPFLPSHPFAPPAPEGAIGPISAAPYGSPSILPISWMYIRMMGPEGLVRATQTAILNANYMAARLRGAYDVLYTGKGGRVAHEFILDTRPFKKSAGVEVDDIAKRLMDYGFHAPTMSFPVPGTLMIEPTESESKEELDRFCDAMLAIREEIRDIEEGRVTADASPLKFAPHTSVDVVGEWGRAYSREVAAFPAPWLRDHKYWPTVTRIDNAFGDRNLICTCPPMDALAEPSAE